MAERMHSLLDDPLFRIRNPEGAVRGVPLPEVYAALMADDVLAFEALQPHQQQPWYSFLVQVAAMATARSGHDAVPESAATWRPLLLDLAGGSEDAWHLVVEDVSRPAFMQPPIPEGSLEKAEYKDDTPTPDTLDMLITNKTHDVKQRRISEPRVEHWIFALLTLQTLEGFLGRGNYGIVRMNGGFGNRPLVGLAPELTWGARVQRDVEVLLDHREAVIDSNGFERDGHALLWILSWDGGKKSGIPLDTCDPYFLEICRRIRFTADSSDELTCWRANTSGQRVRAVDDLNGRTGDPWTPVDKGEGKALTLGSGGFTYETLQAVWLSDDYVRPPALEFQSKDPDRAYLIATSLVRGQGKTEGLHRRIIPVPREVTRFFTGPDSARKKLAKRAEDRVRLAGAVQSQVLRRPTLTLVYGGRVPARPDWDKVNPWIEAFDRDVDARFFDALWASVRQGLSEDEAEIQWQEILRELAETRFEQIRDSIPLPSIHRYRVLSDADAQFHSRLRSVLDRTFDSSVLTEEESDAQHTPT